MENLDVVFPKADIFVGYARLVWEEIGSEIIPRECSISLVV